MIVKKTAWLYKIVFFCCLGILTESYGQTCIENKLSGEELANMEGKKTVYTFSAKEYYTLADVTFKKTGTESDLQSGGNDGIWIGENNGQIGYGEIAIEFSKPVQSVSFLLSHLNNDHQAGREEIQQFSVLSAAEKDQSRSSSFVWTTGSASGNPHSREGATSFDKESRTISAADNVCCEYGSGRISISNKEPFSKITFRHQYMGTNPKANGVILSDLIFCVYIPPAILVKDTARLPKAKPVYEEEIVFAPIYFDFDKAVIRADAMTELDKFVELYSKHPQLQLEINSFSDCRGSTSYNAVLSNKRAKSTMEYLTRKGIPVAQIVNKGLGESNTQACDCEDKESACPEREYENNRRTEVKVISLGN